MTGPSDPTPHGSDGDAAPVAAGTRSRVAAAVADDPGGLLAVATDLSGPSSSNPAPAPALARAPVQPASSAQATASQSQQNDALLALMATSGLDAASLADIIRNAARAPAAVAAAAVAPPAPASAPQRVSIVERQEQAELLELLRAAGGAGGLLEALRYGPSSSRFANGGGEDPVTRACERLASKKAPVTCSTYKPTERVRHRRRAHQQTRKTKQQQRAG